MPNVTIEIGGRNFDVACQDGEEHFLQSAAKLLDSEAQILVDQIGRMPEGRMLLMAGLMLADKTAGMQDQVSKFQAESQRLRAELAALKESMPRIDMSEWKALAQQAESLAGKIESRAAG